MRTESQNGHVDEHFTGFATLVAFPWVAILLSAHLSERVVARVMEATGEALSAASANGGEHPREKLSHPFVHSQAHSGWTIRTARAAG